MVGICSQIAAFFALMPYRNGILPACHLPFFRVIELAILLVFGLGSFDVFGLIIAIFFSITKTFFLALMTKAPSVSDRKEPFASRTGL